MIRAGRGLIKLRGILQILSQQLRKLPCCLLQQQQPLSLLCQQQDCCLQQHQQPLCLRRPKVAIVTTLFTQPAHPSATRLTRRPPPSAHGKRIPSILLSMLQILIMRLVIGEGMGIHHFLELVRNMIHIKPLLCVPYLEYQKILPVACHPMPVSRLQLAM